VAHNEEFEQLLKSLNSNSSDGDGVNDATGDAISGSSKDALEKKSKGSKSRIHYHKFVKNKDLSRASSNDMNGIFGKSLDATVKLLPIIIVDNAESEEVTSPEITEEIHESGESQKENKKRKKKRKKNKEMEETPSPPDVDQVIESPENITDEAEGCIATERIYKKKKRKQKERSVEPDNGNNSNDDNNIEEMPTESISEKDKMDQDDASDTNREIRKKKKKSKKRKREDDIEAQDDILQNIADTPTTRDEIEPEPSSEEPETKRKKKKKSKKAHREEITGETVNDTPNISTESDQTIPPRKDEPNKDTIPSEKVETLGSMQFINRGSIVDYFRNKRQQMLNRISENSLKIV